MNPKIIDIYTRGLGHIGKAAEAVYLRPRNGGIGMPEGRDVFINACHYMVEALEQVTKTYGKTVQDLNWISSHQANQRIIKTYANRLIYQKNVSYEYRTTGKYRKPQLCNLFVGKFGESKTR